MKKKLMYIFAAIAALLLFALCLAAPYIKAGYKMYSGALAQKGLGTAVNEVRSKSGYTELSSISDNFITSVLKSEDRRFYLHRGFDVIAIARATFNNLKTASFSQGGSTITQQLAKNLYFTFEKTYVRKIAELFMAVHIEASLTKDEILELYCNIAYFGENCYGVSAASMHYFGVEPDSLSESQAKALVHTLKSPNNYNPNAMLRELPVS